MIKAEEIRKIEIEDVLIDTGATTLSLPAKYIKQLGCNVLKQLRFQQQPE